MASEGIGGFAAKGLAIIALVIVIAGGLGWAVYEMAGTPDDPWIEQDGALTVTLLSKIAEEYHVEQARETREAHAAMTKRFNAHLKRAVAAAGPRVIGLAVLAAGTNGPSTLLRSARMPRYGVQRRFVHQAGGKDTDITVEYATYKDRSFLVFSKPCVDRFSGADKKLRWTAYALVDPAVSPRTGTAQDRDESGVVLAALLGALAEEYHVLLQGERYRTRLQQIEDDEKAGTKVDPDAKLQAAKDWIDAKEALGKRFTDHLATTRAVADTRCMALVIESLEAGRKQLLLQTPAPGNFIRQEGWTVQRKGAPTELVVAPGTIRRRRALETAAPVHDRFSATGDQSPKLPWTARVWLNADDRQAPPRR